MDRMTLAVQGVDGALGGLDATGGDPAVAYVAMAEGVYWITAADECLLQVDPDGWGDKRGQLIMGLRYARNVNAHEMDAWVQPAEGVFSNRFWDEYYEWVWRSMPPPVDDRWAAQHVAYTERVHGRSVRDTLADARDLIRQHWDAE